MTDHPCIEYPAPATDPAPVDAVGACVELVCGDAGLLRAEFDAIIAANFPGGAGQRHRRPPLRRARLLTERSRPRTPAGPATAGARSGPARVSAGLRARARERSPPEDRRR